MTHPAPHPKHPLPFPQALLRVPLFYKILIANATLVTLGAVAGVLATTYAMRHAPGQSSFTLVLVLAVAGVLSSIAMNALILRVALRPLHALEATAERVRRGDLDARAQVPAVSDAALERLIGTFNDMLDGIGAYRGRLRDVAARALEATEEERKRIALELHDETAQTLASLLVRLRIARGTADAEERNRLLDEVRAELAAALEGVRRFAQGLRPAALDVLGLGRAIEAHARSLEQASGLEVDVDADPLSGQLTADAELALYRVVQEALSNAARHAGAERVLVQIRLTPDAVHAIVEDDGRGFDVAQALSGGRGLGLFGMQERAAYIGGSVRIESTPARGTRVDVKIPIMELRRNV